MADEGPSSSGAAPQDDLTVGISVVSPSVSVNTPLNFPNLSPSTTVGQVKQKIREALDSKPSNEHQRLIHQGKLLNREQETFLEVFGEQRVRSSPSAALESCAPLHKTCPEGANADKPPTYSCANLTPSSSTWSFANLPLPTTSRHLPRLQRRMAQVPHEAPSLARRTNLVPTLQAYLRLLLLPTVLTSTMASILASLVAQP